MQHLIVGFGYSGSHLAQELLRGGKKMLAISRHLEPSQYCEGLDHLALDIEKTALPEWETDTVLYYFVPPPRMGQKDTLLRKFLQSLSPKKLTRVIYCSSSGVYGDQKGAWIDESATLYCLHDRQRRRLDAEKAWQSFCKTHAIPLVILRTAGIYGPDRLPIAACKAQTPVLKPSQAPFSNAIYVRDLAKAAFSFSADTAPAGTYNLADGKPLVMGELQQKLAAMLGYAAAPEQAYATIWEQASPMKREFMQSSKRLRIDKLSKALPAFQPTALEDALNQLIQKELSP